MGVPPIPTGATHATFATFATHPTTQVAGLLASADVEGFAGVEQDQTQVAQGEGLWPDVPRHRVPAVVGQSVQPLLPAHDVAGQFLDHVTGNGPGQVVADRWVSTVVVRHAAD